MQSIGSGQLHANDLVSWLLGPVRQAVPYRRLMLIQAELCLGEVRVGHILPLGHEAHYVAQLRRSFQLQERGCIAWWLRARTPFVLDPDHPPGYASAFEVDEARRFRLGRILAHGVIDHTSRTATYCSFAGLPAGDAAPWISELRMLAPHLHARYMDHLAQQVSNPVHHSPSLSHLTPRQTQIARLALDGLDDKTIARRLSLSDKTVRNQLSVVYRRLEVSNRAELLARLR